MRFTLLPLIAMSVACSGSAFTQSVSTDEPVVAGEAGEGPGSGGEHQQAGGQAVGGEPAQEGGSGGQGGSEQGGDGGEPVAVIGGAPVASSGAGGTAEEAGAGGTGPVVPDINECSGPVAPLVCDGLCGRADGCVCSVIATEGRVVVGGVDNPTNANRESCGGCSGYTLRLKVSAMTCSRFTVQAGATVGFMVEGKSCAENEKANQCMVVSGLVDNTGTDRTVAVSRPSQNAWIQQESADLVMGRCPLSCP
jgi:hypothetical protein